MVEINELLRLTRELRVDETLVFFAGLLGVLESDRFDDLMAPYL